MNVSKLNYKSIYDEFMNMYDLAQEKLKSSNVVDNDLYTKCLEYSFNLTEYFNPMHPLQYIDEHEMIKSLYYIRAELLTRTVGIDTKKGSLSDNEKQVFHIVIALLRKSMSVAPLYHPAIDLFKIVVIYLTISNPNAEENVSNLKQVLSVYPWDYQLQFNLAFAYQRNNDLDNAVSAYKMTLGLIDLHSEKNDETLVKFKIKALNGIGGIYHSVQDRHLAKYYFEVAHSILPNDPDINNQLGVVHTELRNTDLAIKYYKTGIAHYKETHISTDLDMLIACMYMNMGLAMCYQCDFYNAIESYNKALKYKPTLSLAYQNKLLDLNYISHLIDDPMYISRMHKNISKIYEQDISDYKKSLPHYKKKDLENGDKLTLGFVSGDFICHPVSYFMNGILKGVDKFNIVCYSGKIINVKSEYPNCKWVTIKGKSRVELAKCIIEDGIDILFDLSGHTGDNRLDTFVLKPAPIQISYCGYPGTSGLKSMDYRITDKFADCEKSEKYYSEKLIYMNDCFLNYTPVVGPDTLPVPEQSPFEKNGYITFGCFNRFNKINDLVIETWEKILVRSKDSRLLVKTKEFVNKSMKDKFLNSFTDKSLLDRITIIDYSDTYTDHLPDYNLMDVSLDTFPYSGTTTSCESLFMGVPVLTLYDNERHYHSQNVTTSLLINSNLKEYVCYSESDYVNKAVELGRLGNNKSKDSVRKQFLNGKVCDSKKFVENFQNKLESIYDNHNW